MAPSYDYQTLVDTFQRERRLASSSQDKQHEHLQSALTTIQTLEKSCPLTPLLWMQYSRTVHDYCILNASKDDAARLQNDVLEQGLLQFPGSALLWLYKIHCDNNNDKLQTIKEAIRHIGRGSHINEDVWIVQLFRQYTQLTDHEAWVERAACPMKEQNSTLFDEWRDANDEQPIPDALEEARRASSIRQNEMAHYEDLLDVAMQGEGILARNHPDWASLNWDAMLSSDTNTTFGMGMGGAATAAAFAQYYTASKFNDSVMERALAECPTVEHLWKQYLFHTTSKKDRSAVAKRAFYNCPYSVFLFTYYIQTMDMDDNILQHIQDGLQLGFIHESLHVDLYLVGIQRVEHKLLLQTTGSDDETSLYGSSTKWPPPETSSQLSDDDALQQVEDLLDDLEDMYESIHDKFKKQSLAKRKLYQHQAQAETLFLCDLRRAVSSDVPNNNDSVTAQHWTKAIRASNPAHPDLYWHNICQVIHEPVSNVCHIVPKLQYIRGLFSAAMQNTGPCNTDEASGEYRDYSAALSNLCHEWTQYERLVGNRDSQNAARQAMQRKVEKAERKREDHHSQRQSKRSKTDHNNHPLADNTTALPDKTTTTTAMEAEPETTTVLESKEKGTSATDTIKQPSSKTATNATGVVAKNRSAPQQSDIPAKPLKHKVKVGKMEYPAHPFTVRVSNLHPSVQDMDLVDAFRPKCGAIVHAKIMRQHHNHMSKGWGLIQFEERESVERALELDDVLGLHEQTVNVSRSHMAAASLVPPGQHRVNEKGSGKFSKRNEKRKQQHPDNGGEESSAKKQKRDESDQTAPPPSTKAGSVLAFQPRAVARGAQKKKTKIKLDP